jgi:hypothetical protein
MTDREASRYRALDMLHRVHPPKLAGRAPFWRPSSPECAARVHIPSWTWTRPLTDDDGPYLTVLDANGAYLSAAATVDVAHGALRRGGRRTFDPSLAGYWLVEPHSWAAWQSIMSPLGGRPAPRGRRRTTPTALWLTTPTAELLAQLTDAGHWPGVDILDSWIGDATVRLRAWASAIRRDRDAARVQGCATPNDDATCCAPHRRLNAIKEGYATAVVLLGKPDACAIYRPDWMHAIRAQSAASIWRKAWTAVQAGYALAGAAHVDELVFPRRAAVELWQRAHAGAQVPIRIDPARLGAFKVKAGSVPLNEWAVAHG